MGIEIGTGIADITAFKPGVGMMGYVKAGQIVEAVESPIFARAFVAKDPATGQKAAFVVAEICFITMAVKRGVMERLATEYSELGYDERHVMVTATHTHGAPGGYSQYCFYNSSIPGFVPEVYEAIVDGIVQAIAHADRTAVPGRIRLAAGEFDPEIPVAFNRSLAAYNANPEVTPLKHEERHLAVDREMTLLRFETADGEAIGAFNWFGTHGTSVPNSNRKVTPDNKGYAAQFFEQAQHAQGCTHFVAGFAQGAAGDVSPNFQRYPGKSEPGGQYEDGFESARYAGLLQCRKARTLFHEAESAPALAPTVDSALMWVDMANVQIPADLANGEAGHHTTGAAIGARMLQGTAEGRGIPPLAGALVQGIARVACLRERLAARFLPEDERAQVAAKFRAQGKKVIFMEMGDTKILGSKRFLLNVLPGWVDPTVAHMKAIHRRRARPDGEPWSPQVLPIQLVILGELAIAGVPGELTTQSGRRLRALLAEALAPRGVTRVITCGYANAYSGYITTPEEYDLQLYEGASTHFGRWTQPAYMAKFRELAAEMLKPVAERRCETGAAPMHLTREQLSRMVHEERAGA